MIRPPRRRPDLSSSFRGRFWYLNSLGPAFSPSFSARSMAVASPEAWTPERGPSSMWVEAEAVVRTLGEEGAESSSGAGVGGNSDEP